MATATQNSASVTLEAENPKKTLTVATSNLPDLTIKSDLQPPNSSADTSIEGGLKESDESKSVDATTTVVSPTENNNNNNSSGSANDVEKKFRRAERFGVPVQLSEQEKRNSRAERFGIGGGGGGGGGSEASKESEELKRKARAERFGLSVSADEEAKKKARLARFGSDTKTDTFEDEKRKARALRFAQPPSNAVSHVNGKEDVGSNTAIAGKAVGGD